METNKTSTKEPATAPGMIQGLYDNRRRSLGNLNVRTRLTLVYTLLMLGALTVAFAIRSQTSENWQQFVSRRPSVQIMTLDQFAISASLPVALECDAECLKRGEPIFPDLALSPWDGLTRLNDGAAKDYTNAQGKTLRRWSKVRLTFPLEKIRPELLDQKNTLVLALPQINYRSALLRVNGEVWGRFHENQRFPVRLPPALLKAKEITFDLSLELHERSFAFADQESRTPSYAASLKDARDLERFLLLERDSRGAVLATMSRILIAFFALFLFVVIDSTPESLGLAMFLGFEAVAIVLGEGWMDLQQNKFLMHFCYQMGDIFRLYFFIQISRLFQPHTRNWIVIATLLSIPYGIARTMEGEWGLSGLDVIPRMRDMLAGAVGTAVCISALISIRPLRLPWRKAALLLGAACSIQQVLEPLTYYFPEWNTVGGFRGFMNSYQALSVYFGALSALTNISTLENRVQKLSQAKARSDMIEHEMALGQTVQKQFLSLPVLPPDFEVAQAHEAAVYVSGDIYFVHWDERNDRLVLLMCDVTGHGVQAALKATACYMLARNLWASGALEQNRAPKLAEFRRQFADLMRFFSDDTPDIPTFVGIEFYPSTRQIAAYRSNFNAPIVIEPTAEGQWQLRMEPMPDAQMMISSLQPRSLLVLFSDGYIGGSRHLIRLSRYIEERLLGFDGSPDQLRDIVTSFDQQNPDRPNDDRTLLVLSWQRHGVAIAAPQASQQKRA